MEHKASVTYNNISIAIIKEDSKMYRFNIRCGSCDMFIFIPETSLDDLNTALRMLVA